MTTSEHGDGVIVNEMIVSISGHEDGLAISHLLKRAPSDNIMCELGQQALWERSQSDANLFQVTSVSSGADVVEENRAVPTNVSEHSKVYWDLSKAVDNEKLRQSEPDRVSSPTCGEVIGGPCRSPNASSVLDISSEFILVSGDIEEEDEGSDRSLQTAGAFSPVMTASVDFMRRHSPRTLRIDQQQRQQQHLRSTTSATGARAATSLDHLAFNAGDYSVCSTTSSCSTFLTSGQHQQHYHRVRFQGSDTASAATSGANLESNNYFCESDFDPSREERPNYEARRRAVEEEMMGQLAWLKGMAGGEEEEDGGDLQEQCQALEACSRILASAWDMPHVGRDCATALCTLFRREGVVDFVADCVAHSCVRVCLSAPGRTRRKSGVANGVHEDANIVTVENGDVTAKLRRRLLIGAADLLSQILTTANVEHLLQLHTHPPCCSSLSPSPAARVNGGDEDPSSSCLCVCLCPPMTSSPDTSTSSAGRRRGSTHIASGGGATFLVEEVVRRCWMVREDAEVNRHLVAILEGLLKHSEATCRSVIEWGGLRSLIFACRSTDRSTLRHAACALTNLALYGGPHSQADMIRQSSADWLFPLAFHREDDFICYYACLAIVVLSANKKLAPAVHSSGTLELVLPFLRTHSPLEFARAEHSHRQGRSPGWLRRLLPALLSEREEVQALAAFHFAMESEIKADQGKIEVFREIGAIDILRRIAASPVHWSSKFALVALSQLGEEVPHRLSPRVHQWSEEDVQHWLTGIGFGDLVSTVATLHIDGDLLLSLTEQTIKEDLSVTNGISRKRLLRELNRLKQTASYRDCDPTCVGRWLSRELGPEFLQYTYNLLEAGVDRPFLPRLTNEILKEDCHMVNGVHRAKLLQAILGCQMSILLGITNSANKDSIQSQPIPNPSLGLQQLVPDVRNRPLDIFISYRRSTGSQLASLLKVHLQLRGYRVFLDIERLLGGKFDENLLGSIRGAGNFVLVLTEGALDRCLGDERCADWVHKECVCALTSQCNIIPVVDRFQWPVPESLPEDMRAVCNYNAITWVHDYQDACVDKLESFLIKSPGRYELSPFSSPWPYPRLHRTLTLSIANAD